MVDENYPNFKTCSSDEDVRAAYNCMILFEGEDFSDNNLMRGIRFGGDKYYQCDQDNYKECDRFLRRV